MFRLKQIFQFLKQTVLTKRRKRRKGEILYGKKFVNWIGQGATLPFIVIDQFGEKWVVKACGNSLDPMGKRSVVNEFLVAQLAIPYGLPWPKVEIIYLEDEVVCEVRNVFQLTTSVAVAIEYRKDIKPIDGPSGNYSTDDNFPLKNAVHIRSIFQKKSAYKYFYAKAIFDHWVLMLEDPRYDSLLIDKDEMPFFLDGSYALGGLLWDEEKLVYGSIEKLEVSPYLEGILVDKSQFDPWLLRLKQFDKRHLLRAIMLLPTEWEVPIEFIEKLQEVLIDQKETFVKYMEEAIEKRFDSSL